MKKIIYNRREFIATLTAGAGSAFLGSMVLGPSSYGCVRRNDPLQMITLGKSEIKTTLLGMGTGFNGYNHSSSITRAGKGVAELLIRYAYEKGIRFFDCADSYGTHLPVKEALKGFPRESYVLGTKIWLEKGGIPESDRPDADKLIDRFRKELDTDYIDLIQIHCMTSPDWTDRHQRQMNILENLKAKKVIRAHGVSVHSMDAMEAATASSWVDVIHVRINPYGEAMDDRDPKKIIPVIEKIHGSGKGVIGMKLIGGGKLKNDPDKIDASLKFVLGLNCVDLIIIGFEQPDQIDNYLIRMKKALSAVQAS